MKILSSGLLFNLFIAAISGKSLRELDQSQRYIITYPANQNPLNDLESAGINEENKYNIGEHIYSVATLTDQQAALVANRLGSSGSIFVDSQIDLPSDNIDDQPTIEIADVTTYLNNAPKCNATVNNVDIFVVDSVIFKDLPEFSEVAITNLPSTVGDTPCAQHGSEVASIIVGKNVGMITSGDRRLYGIGVFNCEGKGTLSGLISAFNTVQEHDKVARKQGRRTVVNFSGTSVANDVVDSIATALYKAGIPVFAAAGNYAGNACTMNSPARAAGVYTLGATQNPGNIPATFSNFGPECVEAFLPGSPVTTLNIYTNRTKSSYGTSFSSPIGAAEGAIELNSDLQATPDQIYQRITARTVTVNTVNGFPMQVMLAKSACNLNRKLFSSYATKPNDNNRFNTWYGGINNIDQKLCVKFSAQFLNTKGWLSIGLRQNATDAAVLKIKIGDYIKKKSYEHSMRQNNKVLTSQRTTGRIVNIGSSKDLQIEQFNHSLSVSYMNGASKIKLLDLANDIDYNEVAFSADAQAKVKYTNAFAC